MMKLTNKFTTLTLTAALVPALILGSAALATEHDENGMQDENRTGEQGFDQQQSDEHDLDQQRSDDEDFDDQNLEDDWSDENGMDQEREDDQDFDQQRDDEERSDELGLDDQRQGEDFMSNKPAGALYSDDLIGKTVKHRQSGDDVGEITDLVIGEDGQIVGVVVTTGSFLGLGGQEVSMNWDQLQHSMEDDESVFYTDMDEESLKNAPEFDRN